MDVITEKYSSEYKILSDIAKSYGYTIVPTTANNCIHLKSNTISLRFYEGITSIIFLCHEIGHAKDYRLGNYNHDKYVKNKVYRIYREVVAWLYGYKFYRKHSLSKTQYLMTATKSVWSYIRFKLRTKGSVNKMTNIEWKNRIISMALCIRKHIRLKNAFEEGNNRN